MNRNRLVVVLGVHRSGTSLTMHALQLLGVDIGERLIPGKADNPDGYFENEDIVERHKKVETLIGRKPFEPAGLLPYPEGWHERPDIRAVGDELAEIVAGEMRQSGGRLWGFKDPRTMRLLPLWRSVFAQLGVQPLYVVALRDPAAVVASMQRRNGLRPQEAELLWVMHMADMLRDTGASVASVVEYERWLAEPLEMGRSVAADLRLPEPGQQFADDIRGTVKAEWDHARRRDLPPLSPPTRQLYQLTRLLRDAPQAAQMATAAVEALLGNARLFAPWTIALDSGNPTTHGDMAARSRHDERLKARVNDAVAENARLVEAQKDLERLLAAAQEEAAPKTGRQADGPGLAPTAVARHVAEREEWRADLARANELNRRCHEAMQVMASSQSSIVAASDPDRVLAEGIHERPPLGRVDRSHAVYDALTQRAKYAALEALAPRQPEALHIQFPDLACFAPQQATVRPLKVCIATEDIVGPVRNGGIGTTFAHLAHALADWGHDVTILYLRGAHSENGPIERWVEHYARHGIAFVPVAPIGVTLDCASPRWVEPMLAMFHYLRDHHFDLVHVSEWRGSALLCLTAKRQGIAFPDTVFCVKASSPWLWNRDYSLKFFDSEGDLTKIFAEQKSIELADMVIGGSAHLLRWMMVQGYRLPSGRTHVQPNVLRLTELEGISTDAANLPGSRVPVHELVFFGRLESRKGLHVFCDAVSRLVRSGIVPKKISFVGKEGGPMPDSGLRGRSYIEDRAKAWSCPIEIHDGWQYDQAIRYLVDAGRLAVMPSIIENSSLALYEALFHRVPFIASDVGGNAELVHPDDRDVVLVEPHPAKLWRKLAAALSEGAHVPRAAFDNSDNLRMWSGFHARMSELVHAGEARRAYPVAKPASEATPRVCACIVHRDAADRLHETLSALGRQTHPDLDVIVVDDDSTDPEALAALDLLTGAFAEKGWRLVRSDDRLGYAACQNLAARYSEADYLLLMDLDNLPKPDAVERLASVASATGAAMVTSFYEQSAPAEAIPNDTPLGPRPEPQPAILSAPIGPDPAMAFYRSPCGDCDLLVSRDVFQRLGGLASEYQVEGDLQEFATRAFLGGHRVEVVPLPLYRRREPQAAQRHSGEAFDAEPVRSLKAYVDSAPLALRNILWSARGFVESLRLAQQRLVAERRRTSKLEEANKRQIERLSEIRKANEQLRSTIDLHRKKVNDLEEAIALLRASTDEPEAATQRATIAGSQGATWSAAAAFRSFARMVLACLTIGRKDRKGRRRSTRKARGISRRLAKRGQRMRGGRGLRGLRPKARRRRRRNAR